MHIDKAITRQQDFIYLKNGVSRIRDAFFLWFSTNGNGIFSQAFQQVQFMITSTLKQVIFSSGVSSLESEELCTYT